MYENMSEPNLEQTEENEEQKETDIDETAEALVWDAIMNSVETVNVNILDNITQNEKSLSELTSLYVEDRKLAEEKCLTQRTRFIKLKNKMLSLNSKAFDNFYIDLDSTYKETKTYIDNSLMLIKQYLNILDRKVKSYEHDSSGNKNYVIIQAEDIIVSKVMSTCFNVLEILIKLLKKKLTLLQNDNDENDINNIENEHESPLHLYNYFFSAFRESLYSF